MKLYQRETLSWLLWRGHQIAEGFPDILNFAALWNQEHFQVKNIARGKKQKQKKKQRSNTCGWSCSYWLSVTVHQVRLLNILGAQSSSVSQLGAAIFACDSYTSITKRGRVVMHHTVVIIRDSTWVNGTCRHLPELGVESWTRNIELKMSWCVYNWRCMLNFFFEILCWSIRSFSSSKNLWFTLNNNLNNPNLSNLSIWVWRTMKDVLAHQSFTKFYPLLIGMIHTYINISFDISGYLRENDEADMAFEWFISLTAWDVIPVNVDVTIPIGTGLLVPEPESMS